MMLTGFLIGRKRKSINLVRKIQVKHRRFFVCFSATCSPAIVVRMSCPFVSAPVVILHHGKIYIPCAAGPRSNRQIGAYLVVTVGNCSFCLFKSGLILLPQ